MKSWNICFLRYFDWNDDGITNWWEYFIPIGTEKYIGGPSGSRQWMEGNTAEIDYWFVVE